MTKKVKKPTKKPDTPKKITVGELVLRQVEQEGVKWDAIFNQVNQSPYIKVLQDALERTREIGEMLNSHPELWETLRKVAEMQRQLVEPMQKFAEPMRKLNEQLAQLGKINAFSLPPAWTHPFQDIPLPTIELPQEEQSDQELYPIETTYSFPVPISPVVVMKERFEQLEAKLEQTIQTQFDNFIEKTKIPAGIKNANCHCSHCGHLVVKVAEMSHFMKGSIKCGGCSKVLNIPTDLIVKSAKD